jgi:hypothetical protein
MREIFEFDLAGHEPFEVSAMLMSALAWPGVEDRLGRERLYLSLCSLFIRAGHHAKRDPEWAQQRQSIRPIYACRAEARIKLDVKTHVRRLRDRVTAGQMAIPYLTDAAPGVMLELPEGAIRPSLNQLVQHLDIGIANTENGTVKPNAPSLRFHVLLGREPHI